MVGKSHPKVLSRVIVITSSFTLLNQARLRFGNRMSVSTYIESNQNSFKSKVAVKATGKQEDWGMASYAETGIAYSYAVANTVSNQDWQTVGNLRSLRMPPYVSEVEGKGGVLINGYITANEGYAPANDSSNMTASKTWGIEDTRQQTSCVAGSDQGTIGEENSLNRSRNRSDLPPKKGETGCISAYTTDSQLSYFKQREAYIQQLEKQCRWWIDGLHIQKIELDCMDKARSKFEKRYDELLEARKQGRRNYEWLKHIKEKEKRQLENQRAEWCQRKTKVTTTKKIRRRFAVSQIWSSSTSDDEL